MIWLRAKISVASHYGITLADVNTLKLWELNYLLDELDQEAEVSKRPPGSIPVMT